MHSRHCCFTLSISCIPALSNIHRPTRAFELTGAPVNTQTRTFVCVWETAYYCVGYIKAGLSRVACWNVNVMTVEPGQCRSRRLLCGTVREARTVSAFCVFTSLGPDQRFRPLPWVDPSGPLGLALHLLWAILDGGDLNFFQSPAESALIFSQHWCMCYPGCPEQSEW